MRKKTSDFFSAKKKLEMLEFLHKYARLCSLCGSCLENRMDAERDVERRLKDSIKAGIMFQRF